MNPPSDKTPGATAMAGILDKLLEFLRARDSYPTRAWIALFLPVLAGTVLGWSMREKLEGFLVGLLVVVFYTLAELVWKKYLKPK